MKKLILAMVLMLVSGNAKEQRIQLGPNWWMIRADPFIGFNIAVDKNGERWIIQNNRIDDKRWVSVRSLESGNIVKIAFRDPVLVLRE